MTRTSTLIRQLQLQPHPEGGYFRQTFRSALAVASADARGERAALTLIYFLLTDADISRWHRVASDEAWHWYEGAPLQLFSAPTQGGAIHTARLGPFADDAEPQLVVPASHWQAARSCGDYTLVGCSVGPGFEFADFTLLSALPEHARPRITPAALCAELL